MPIGLPGCVRNPVPPPTVHQLNLMQNNSAEGTFHPVADFFSVTQAVHFRCGPQCSEECLVDCVGGIGKEPVNVLSELITMTLICIKPLVGKVQGTIVEVNNDICQLVGTALESASTPCLVSLDHGACVILLMHPVPKRHRQSQPQPMDGCLHNWLREP